MRTLLFSLAILMFAMPAWADAAAAVPAAAAAPLPAGVTVATNAASAVQVEAKLSTATPTFGDTIELVATLRYPNTYRVFFPAHPNVRPLLADPANAGKSERTESGGQVTETIRVPLLVVKSGLLRTPAIEVPFHVVTAGGGAGESGSVTVPSLKIVVKSQFANDNTALPSPLPKPRPLIEENVPLEIALGVLAMMLLSAGLTALGLKVYKNRAALLRPKPVVPPHLQAFGRLTELERSGRLANETPRVVVAELSEILREYLGGRFRFYALDMTSTELLERVKALDLKHVRLEEVQRFADTSDLVKFAGLPATPEELVEMHLYVRDVVEKTMQTAQELELQRAAETARLALQKKLRLQVMAPTALRVRALALDLAFGSVATSGLAFLAIHTGRQGLFDAAYALWFVWLALRDAVGGSSPGKAITGLEIAAYEVESGETRRGFHNDAPPEEQAFLIAKMATWGAKLQRNLLLAVPGAGFVAEAWTALALPEQRRFGDQWAGTRVIDARHGRRKGKPAWWPAVVAIVLAVALWLLPLVLGGRPA